MLHHRLLILVMILTSLLWHPLAMAEVSAPVKVAQVDSDDTYDPFADYSEFDQAQDEEEDINFFKNGRFVTIGLLLGYRGFTETMARLVSPGIEYGLFLNYFFDLRFAIQFSFETGDHPFSIPSAIGNFGGDISFQDFGFNLKYYVNTQNVTKGLAAFNPYVLVGFSEIFRTINAQSTSAFGKDSSTGFNLGGGIEMPLMRNKMFYGFQGMYQLVNFPDSGSPLLVGTNYNTGIYPHGQTYTINGTIGINF